MDPPLRLHATALVIGECGILLEGASGTGKSSLADALVAAAMAQGRFGRLVGDDRVDLAAANGRIVARPHPAIAGLVEHRGLGLLHVPHEPACVLHLAVQLVGAGSAALTRLPEPAVRVLLGLALPQVVLPALAPDNVRRVTAALTIWASAFSNGSNKLAKSTAMHKIARQGAASGANAEPM